MKLPKAAYQWSLKHLGVEGDSDLFPVPFEIRALLSNHKLVVDQLSRVDIENYQWTSGRRFVVPKDVLSFRIATQLKPLDSIVLGAIIKKYGHRFEAKRSPPESKQVYSYRFLPTQQGRLYEQGSAWHDFWARSLELAKRIECTHVVVTDITDYYNQIYHHVLENQIQESDVPKAVFTALKGFVTTMTDKVSRGIPVGPHAVHLLAELAQNVLDSNLSGGGYTFCRYVDDIHVFCTSEQAAIGAVYDLAQILDEQQRLTLNRQKTEIYQKQDFVERAVSMLSDNPETREERKLLDIIWKHSGSDPYRMVALNSLSVVELKALSPSILSALLQSYLAHTPVNYPRIGWLLRRLAQVGAPGAIETVLDNLGRLAPVFGEAARYLMRSMPNYKGDPVEVGKRLIASLETPIVQKSEYLQVMLMDIFEKLPQLNHVGRVTSRYPHSPTSVKRQILCVAREAGYTNWLRGQKSAFHQGDWWLRSAMLWASSAFPGDEGLIWVKGVAKQLSGVEKLVIRHAYGKSTPKLGDIRIDA